MNSIYCFENKRDNSSTAVMYIFISPPAPPNSLGTLIPIRPHLAIFLTVSNVSKTLLNKIIMILFSNIINKKVEFKASILLKLH